MQSRKRDDSLNAVLDSLRRILQSIRLSSSVVQDRLGITGAQLFVLQELAALPGASLRGLAERTLTDQSSVSVVVRRLVEAGHVARRTSASDARRTELSLTDSGRALLRRAPALAQTRLVAALRATPLAQRRTAARVLAGLADAVSPADAPAQMFFEPPDRKRGAPDRKRGAPRRRVARPRTRRPQ